MTLKEFAETTTEQDIAKWCAENPDVILNDEEWIASSCIVARVAQHKTGSRDVKAWYRSVYDDDNDYPHLLGSLVDRYDKACPNKPWTASECAKSLGLEVAA